MTGKKADFKNSEKKKHQKSKNAESKKDSVDLYDKNETDSIMNIQWFPGHMTKTKRMIEDDIKIVDAVVEVVDARCPEASRNPVLDELIKSKPRVVILNKCDYADEKATISWKAVFEKRNISVLVCDCRSGKGVSGFIPLLKKQLADVLEHRRDKGMAGKALRVMVVGIPNVGKSSFINRMANSRKTKVGDTPGVTRGKQWVTIDKEVELLDMPGILWPKFDDKQAALLLAYTGAIKDKVMDTEELADNLGRFLLEEYRQELEERYKLEDLSGIDINDKKTSITVLIAKSRGMLLSGGIPDTERAATALLDDYRGGRIGKITLEKPNGN